MVQLSGGSSHMKVMIQLVVFFTLSEGNKQDKVLTSEGGVGNMFGGLYSHVEGGDGESLTPNKH